jgi:hypothetical protein
MEGLTEASESRNKDSFETHLSQLITDMKSPPMLNWFRGGELQA